MNGITTFMKLEYYTLKPYSKSIVLLFAIAITQGIFTASFTLFFSLILGMAMLLSSLFSVGEKNSMGVLYSTLSLKREHVVIGRYLFSLIIEIICVILVLALSYLLLAAGRFEGGIAEIILYLSVMSFMYALTLAVQYPVYFRVGYDKAKWVAYMPVLFIGIFVFLYPKINEGLSWFIEFVSDPALFMHLDYRVFLLFGLPFILGHLLFAVSCVISCRVYKARDL